MNTLPIEFLPTPPHRGPELAEDSFVPVEAGWWNIYSGDSPGEVTKVRVVGYIYQEGMWKTATLDDGEVMDGTAANYIRTEFYK